MVCHELGLVVTLELGPCVFGCRQGTVDSVCLLASQESGNEDTAEYLPLVSNHPLANSQSTAAIVALRLQNFSFCWFVKPILFSDASDLL